MDFNFFDFTLILIGFFRNVKSRFHFIYKIVIINNFKISVQFLFQKIHKNHDIVKYLFQPESEPFVL